MYTIQEYPPRVTRGEDGVYRWSYPMNPRRNKHPLSVVGRVFFAMGALGAMGMFIAGPPTHTMSVWDMPLMVLGVFGGVFLLVTLLLYLQGDDRLAYAMDREGITTFRAKVAGPHLFSCVRRVRLMPQHDAIRLGFGVTIYVPSEDYEAVKAFILEHLPPSAHVR